MKKYSAIRHTFISGAVLLANTGVAAQNGATEAGTLEETTVIAQKQPYRGDISLESLPQQVQVLPSDLLAKTGKVEFQHALDLAGGVARQNSFGGLWDSFAIRGFAGDENLPSGYLINGFSGGRGFSGNRDTSNIDSVEILKGPGSALYGRGEPGGTINVITKKPEFDQQGYIKAAAGRYDTYRIEGDYTNAIHDTAAFRINGAFKDAGSFRDYVDTQKTVLTPSFLLLLSDSASLNYELEYLKQKTPFDRGIVAVDGDPKVLPVSRFVGEPAEGAIEVDATGHQFLLQKDLNAGWSLLGGLGYRESSFEGCSSDPELSRGRQTFDEDNINLNRQRRCRDYDAEDLSGRFELTGRLETGALVHHLLVGIDAYRYELDSLQLLWRDEFLSATYSIDVFTPVYGQSDLADYPLEPQTNRLEKQNAWGAYIQNQIDLSGQWKMLLGFRYDDFSQDIENRGSSSISHQDQTEKNPRVGLVYEPMPNLSLYASYAEGFRPNSGAGADNTPFEPEKSKSRELGVKWSSDDGNLTATVAVFKMEKSNILTADPVNSGFSAALGEAESQGLEIDISGKLSDSLSMMFNYAYVDAETSNDVINADWGVVIPAGSRLINIPQHSANLMLSRQLTLGGAPASVGFTLNYVDERLGETIDPDYLLPAYTLLNLFGAYNLSENVRLSLNIDNLTNEKHYVSSYHKWWTMPGSPMNYTLAISYFL